MKPDKVLSLLGIAAKANGIASGEFQTEHSVKDGTAWLVIIAEDASDNTKKMFRNMCTFYEVDMVVYGTKDTLGHCIGKEFRASLAVTNEGLANAIKEKLAIITTE